MHTHVVFSIFVAYQSLESSLAQRLSRGSSNDGDAVFVGADAQSEMATFRYIGRSHSDEEGHPRFDASGFEVQFRVRGASQVAVWMQQEISGPFGWYRDDIAEGTELWTKREQQLGRLSPPPFLARSASLLEEEAELYSDSGTASRMEEPGSQPHTFLVYVDGEPVIGPLEEETSACWGCTFDTTQAKKGVNQRYVAATGLNPDEEHEIRIFKTSDPEWSSVEPTPNWLTFHGASLDAGEVLATALPRPKRRLEFVGDSTASGYCNLCERPKTNVERQGSYAVAWPTMTCEHLGVECHSLMWAGYGVHQNCCLNNELMMPHIWPRALASDGAHPWNFSTWVPHGLVISLGANDHIGKTTEPQGSDPDAFMQDYLAFVQSAHASYGPELHVFLACGDVKESRKSCPYVQTVVDKASALGIRAHYLDQEGFHSGCCGHPSAYSGISLADAAAKVIAEKLGWNE